MNDLILALVVAVILAALLNSIATWKLAGSVDELCRQIDRERAFVTADLAFDDVGHEIASTGLTDQEPPF